MISPRGTSPASPRGTTPASRLRACATSARCRDQRRRQHQRRRRCRARRAKRAVDDHRRTQRHRRLRARSSAWAASRQIPLACSRECRAPSSRTGHTTITVDGNVTAIDANTVLLREMTVNGNVTLIGGGGEIPWSIKGNTIGGNLTISRGDGRLARRAIQRDRRQRDADQHHSDSTRATRAGPSPSSKTRSGGTSTARDWPQACPEVSSPARSTTSVTRRSVSAQRSAPLI